MRERSVLRLVVCCAGSHRFYVLLSSADDSCFLHRPDELEPLRAPKWVGLDNYIRLFQDEKFWKSIWITFLYVVYNIPIQTVLGLLIAVLLKRLTGSVFVRSVMLMPFLVSNVIAAMIWFYMFDPVLGFVNVVLKALGLGSHAFFSDPNLALPTIAFINVWRHMGYTALLFYTGLQSIPEHLYEAARIEGASEWRMFRSVTLPLLRPTLVFVLVTSVIGSFQIFDTIAVTTQGGPGTATRTVLWYIYQEAFVSMRMGYASAIVDSALSGFGAQSRSSRCVCCAPENPTWDNSS
mgnify:CR=1 FL=1